MSNKAENRTRCLTPELFMALKDGVLKPLVSTVKKDKDLIMCFRGQYLNVYYMGHSLFKIEQQSRGYKISFNFNHARYTEDWEGQLKKLIDIGYHLHQENKLKFPCRDEGKIKQYENYIALTVPLSNIPSDNFWSESVVILKELICDFFDPNKREDYFKRRNALPQNNKANLLEKQRQQQIMIANQTFTAGYYIFDMEYAQARNNRNENGPHGRFDMLALRYDNRSETYNLVYLELKSTKDACTGACDIQRHYTDLTVYQGDENYTNVRKNDAVKICNQYSMLFCNRPEEITISENEAELLFVFTDGAIPYAEKIADEKEKIILGGNSFKL